MTQEEIEATGANLHTETPLYSEQTISFEPAMATNPELSWSRRGTGKRRSRGRRGGRATTSIETHNPPAQPRLRLNVDPHQSHRSMDVRRPLSPEQTMLQCVSQILPRAFLSEHVPTDTYYKITAQDALMDSDEEPPGDHHAYLEYSMQLFLVQSSASIAKFQ